MGVTLTRDEVQAWVDEWIGRGRPGELESFVRSKFETHPQEDVEVVSGDVTHTVLEAILKDLPSYAQDRD